MFLSLISLEIVVKIEISLSPPSLVGQMNKAQVIVGQC